MSEDPDLLTLTRPELRDAEFVVKLRDIERRDWWVWANAIFVILSLTGAVLSLALPSLLQGTRTFLNIKLAEAIYGLVALVIVYSFYTIYQQVLIKRLRRELAENQGHSHILRNLAMLDPLTGLYNRRFAERRLAGEVARSSRKGHPLSVLLLDLNDFKRINDTYGHAAGDFVLQTFASRLNKAIRESDLAVRMGGDEFLVILPECRFAQLEVVLRRLQDFEVEYRGKKIPVTFAFGWKEYLVGDDVEHLLAAADQALYENKRVSKNASVSVPAAH